MTRQAFNTVFTVASDRFDQILGAMQQASVLQIFRITPHVLLASAAVSLIIVQLQQRLQRASTNNYLVSLVAAVGLCATVFLYILAYGVWRKRCPLDRLSGRHSIFAKSFLASIQLGILGLTAVAYLAVWQTHAAQIEWYTYEFLDKRWFLLLYWIGVFVVLIVPAILYRLLNDRAGANTESETIAPPQTIPGQGKGQLPTYAKIILALLITIFLYGPPWNIQRVSSTIDSHELAHLGPLQAVIKGYLPDVGPAATQYGPGTQVAYFAYMKLTDQVNLVGFREAQALIILAGYCIFAIITFWLLDIEWAVLAVILSLSLSPFALTQWNQQGGFAVWGWPNPFRYAGTLAIVALLLWAIQPKKKSNAWIFFLIGIAWGLLCWISPENLMTGVAATVMFLALAWAFETISVKTGVSIIAFVGLGAVTSWVPVALFYLIHGKLQDYVLAIFLVGGQVLSGFSNTPPNVSIAQNTEFAIVLYGIAPLLITIGLMVLYKDFKLIQRPDMSRLGLIAIVCVSLANFFGGLLRVDGSHLLNVLISFPIVMGLAVQNLPSYVFTRPRMRYVFRGALVIALILLVGLQNYALYAAALPNRIARFYPQSMSSDSAAIGDNVLLKRLGYTNMSGKEPVALIDSAKVKQLMESLDDLHRLTEGKSVYVQSFPCMYPSEVYFLANLHPANLYLEPSTMIFSSDVTAQFRAHFKATASNVDIVVSREKKGPEIEMFLAAHPNSPILKMKACNQKYVIIGETNGAPSS